MSATISLDIGSVYPSPTAREVRHPHVAALAESMKEIGLRTPITVRSVMKITNGRDQPAWEIVAGHHRYEAAVRLGWRQIEAIEFDGAELDAELWEIDENLMRSELTEMERARALARRKEIYEIKHPETRQGGDRGNQHTGGRQSDKMSFSQQTAAKIGKTAKTVERSVRIGERLTPEAEDEAKKLGLDDHQAALLDAAKAETAGAQIEVLNRRAATRAREHGEVKDAKSDAREILATLIAEHVPEYKLADVGAALALLGMKEVAARVQALTGAVFDNTRAHEAA